MKKYFFIISLLLSNILSVAQIEYELGSWDVYEDEYENYIPSSGVLDSRNGYSLSPQGQIRFLLVFVELEYIDPQEDPALQGTTEWPVGQ